MTKKIQPVGMWQAIRDITIASMNKGLFALALPAIIFINLVWRMPPADVSKMVFAIGSRLLNNDGLGWLLLLCVLVAWSLHSRWLRKVSAFEVGRVCKERTDLQERGLGSKVESSRG